MENLKNQCEKLAEKETWIRKGLEDFFEIWEKETKTVINYNISSDNIIFSDIDIYDNDRYLYVGINQPCIKTPDGETIKTSLDDIDILGLRGIISKLPSAIEEISVQIKEKIEKTDKISAFFAKFNQPKRP